ncbi:polyamine ABC transporter substrate-binding protein [Ferruginivarius sediminum]|uniref:Putrescine-binding periplasmic protein n=1 Tax=Ferruginivarius sediminum TaxID=2661937 RepID=A0A369T7V1_9PROT|nr:polyamine ABC transporter substrate-binding protein [Ferruginivarius sediminum]RDD60962.1 polyamine ABC transporter substrate-binding protein [Ferruginivarius sediminum]
MINGFRSGLALSAAALLLASGAQAAEEKVLNVYNWSDYIAEDTIPQFEEEFGVEVNYDVYDSNEVLEGKLMAGSAGYDIVVPSDTFFARQIEAGIYQKLDKSKLTNWDNLDDNILQQLQKLDPGNQYGVPYMWGTTGIGYNVDMVKERLGGEVPSSWDLVFDPDVVSKLADCGVTMLDAPQEMFPAARNYLGLDPNSNSTEDLEKAEALLAEIRPHIKYYHSSQYVNDLANGDICLAVGWSGDVYIAADRAAAAEQGVEVNYIIPKEGALLWQDIMAIPKGAPHPENAHKWLNFNLRAGVAAQNVNYVWYASANEAALEQVDPEIKNNPSIYPPKEVMERLYPALVNPPKFDRLQTRAWTAVKTGQ